jgi:hypothetical protein
MILAIKSSLPKLSKETVVCPLLLDFGARVDELIMYPNGYFLAVVALRNIEIH